MSPSVVLAIDRNARSLALLDRMLSGAGSRIRGARTLDDVDAALGAPR
jgi:hypothetical protein